MKLIIPNEYTVGGQEVSVEFVDECGCLGISRLFNGKILIANRHEGYEQSDSSKKNTFYHELIHTILDTMGETNLSANEQFVSSFTGFLIEALESMKL